MRRCEVYRKWHSKRDDIYIFIGQTTLLSLAPSAALAWMRTWDWLANLWHFVVGEQIDDRSLFTICVRTQSIRKNFDKDSKLFDW
jgi:hypothetical protein